MSQIAIELDAQDFTGGDAVTGNVVLTLEAPIPSRGVRIRLQGYERSCWVRGCGRRSSPYGERHDLIHEERTLHGRPPRPADVMVEEVVQGLSQTDHYDILPPGRHQFPFRFTLPSGIPADYESPRGAHIRYELTASVDIPLPVDLSASRRLRVYEPYDPDLLANAQEEAARTIMLERNASLELSARIDRNLFHPGEDGRCAVSLVNQSSRQIERVRLSLAQTEELLAQELRGSERFVLPLRAIEAPQVPRDESVEIEMDFTLPDDLYASIGSGTLVQLDHALLVEVDLAWGGSTQLEIPIRLVAAEGMPSGVRLDR